MSKKSSSSAKVPAKAALPKSRKGSTSPAKAAKSLATSTLGPKPGSKEYKIAASVLNQKSAKSTVVETRESTPKNVQMVTVVLKGGRISDADKRAGVAKTLREVSTDRSAALSFLQGIGVATAKGRLSKRYGG